MQSVDGVWVFNGSGGTFPSGVFYSRSEAESAIERHKLTGTLTKYPVGMLVYDWCISKGMFVPKTENQSSAEFIGKFSSASQEHYHFEDGMRG